MESYTLQTERYIIKFSYRDCKYNENWRLLENAGYDRRIKAATAKIARVMEKNKKKFLNVISSMGIDIADARIEYNSHGKITEVYTKHYGTDNELRMKEESSGIRKILNVLPVILEGMRAGTLFIVDELDAKLHPALLQSIIALFKDPVINTAGAQMLFTSHDLITMNSKVFRRDEIWFSAINGYNESVLYTMVDFEEEKDETTGNVINYNKQYLEGRYD